MSLQLSAPPPAPKRAATVLALWPARERGIKLLVLVALALTSFARAADAPQSNLAQWITAQGGDVVRGPDGGIVEVSLART